MDLSRKKVDVCLLCERGEHLAQLAVPPDADALRSLARRIEENYREPVCAVIESMTGARFVHDTLEQAGWAVEIADAQKVKGLAPLACKTDMIDSLVLATLSQRELVPAIWLPEINRRLREGHADHRYIPPLMSAPGIGWVLAFTIAAEIGEIERFASPEKLCGYTGLCPHVDQSGDKDRRGPLTKHGPTYLRWALLEATMHALKHPACAQRYQRNMSSAPTPRPAKGP